QDGQARDGDGKEDRSEGSRGFGNGARRPRRVHGPLIALSGALHRSQEASTKNAWILERRTSNSRTVTSSSASRFARWVSTTSKEEPLPSMSLARASAAFFVAALRESS